MTMPDGSYGTPYSVSEARGAAKSHNMDQYHRDLILWLCDEVERFEAQLEKAGDEIEQAQTRRLARIQPCGCVVCACDDPQQCHGCGAKSCGKHPVGEIPDPVYEPHPAISKLAEAEAVIKRLEGCLSSAREAVIPKSDSGHSTNDKTGKDDGWDETVTDVDLKVTALEMWANHIETGNVVLSAADASSMKEKSRDLDPEQRQLVQRLRNLVMKERNSEF